LNVSVWISPANAAAVIAVVMASVNIVFIVIPLLSIIPKRVLAAGKAPPRNLLSERAPASSEALLAMIEGEIERSRRVRTRWLLLLSERAKIARRGAGG
jgi:hypothetical protein